MKIAITYTGSDKKQDNYVRWLQAADTEIEVVTLRPGDRYNEAGFDGLVLSGGIDVGPSLYGMAAGYPNAPGLFNTDRDAYEIGLYHQFMTAGKPVLGICRGLQLINCINGGTLKQDLGEEGNLVHRAVPADRSHEIMVMPGTFLQELLVDERVQVNSAHHQSVNAIGSGLAVNCISDDGIIEGLEWKDREGKPFFLCVQWHPERMFSFDLDNTPASLGIRERFIEACNK